MTGLLIVATYITGACFSMRLGAGVMRREAESFDMDIDAFVVFIVIVIWGLLWPVSLPATLAYPALRRALFGPEGGA